MRTPLRVSTEMPPHSPSDVKVAVMAALDLALDVAYHDGPTARDLAIASEAYRQAGYHDEAATSISHASREEIVVAIDKARYARRRALLVADGKRMLATFPDARRARRPDVEQLLGGEASAVARARRTRPCLIAGCGRLRKCRLTILCGCGFPSQKGSLGVKERPGITDVSDVTDVWGDESLSGAVPWGEHEWNHCGDPLVHPWHPWQSEHVAHVKTLWCSGVSDVTRPRLLDLFCGAGGCSVGYHRAGFDMVGVDINPQPNYPYDFHQEDAMEILRDPGYWTEFDAIHASPPCQAYSKAQALQGNDHPDLVGPTRDLLEQTGLPYVIENVKGAPLRDPVMLEGQMFDGLNVHRPRLFETNWPLEVPALIPPPPRQTKMGRPPRVGEAMQVVGHFSDVPAGREAMGIKWMTQGELAQAIPPAYTELIGHQLLQHIRAEAAA